MRNFFSMLLSRMERSAQPKQNRALFLTITYNSHRLVVCGIFIYWSESVCIFCCTPINGMCFIIPLSELVMFIVFFFLKSWQYGQLYLCPSALRVYLFPFACIENCWAWWVKPILAFFYFILFPLPVIRCGRHLDMNLKRKLVWGLQFFLCMPGVCWIY